MRAFYFFCRLMLVFVLVTSPLKVMAFSMEMRHGAIETLSATVLATDPALVTDPMPPVVMNEGSSHRHAAASAVQPSRAGAQSEGCHASSPPCDHHSPCCMNAALPGLAWSSFSAAAGDTPLPAVESHYLSVDLFGLDRPPRFFPV